MMQIYPSGAMRFCDTKKTKIADVVTSATYKALEPNQYGDVEPRYVVNLRNRFIRKNSSVKDEGMAFAPWQASDIDAAQKTLQLLG